MANKQATGAVTKHPVAPTVRGSFIKALGIIGDREGKTLPEMMADLIEQEGLLAVMDRVAKFQERTSTTNINHSGEVNLVNVLSSLAASTEHDTTVDHEPGSIRH